MKTDYTNNRQREMGGGLGNTLIKTAHEIWEKHCPPTFGREHSRFTTPHIIDAMEEYASQFKPIPPSTEALTVDFEREAELEFPYYNNLSGSQINSQSKRSYNYVQDSKRDGYIKGRKTTSQEGLRELVDWMENGTWVVDKDDLKDFILTKANEILNR